METVTRLKGFLTNYGRKYPDVWKFLDDFRNKYRNHSEFGWRDFIFYPLDAARAVLHQGGVVPRHLADDVPILCALGAWRVTQNIYRFDASVFDAVWETEATGSVPVEVLFRMPDWCGYIETPNKRFENKKLHGFFVFLSKNFDVDVHELHFLLDTESGFTGLFVFLIEGKTLQESIETLCDHLTEKRLNDKSGFFPQVKVDEEGTRREFLSFMERNLPPLLSITLFLCSQNGVIPDFENRPQPEYNSKKKRHFPPPEPRVWEVAYRLGAAIRRAETEAQTDKENGSGREAVRPHIRRAHWHGFWKGARAAVQMFFLKWLPPIPVNVSDEEDLIPVIKKVN